MDVLALAVALVVTVLCVTQSRRVGRLEHQLRVTKEMLYAIENELEQTREANARESESVRSELLRLRGGEPFTLDTTIGAATRLHPRAAEILAANHIGGCASCTADDAETIGAAARRLGVDPIRALASLNALASMDPNEPIRIPNVKFPV